MAHVRPGWGARAPWRGCVCHRRSLPLRLVALDEGGPEREEPRAFVPALDRDVARFFRCAGPSMRKASALRSRASWVGHDDRLAAGAGLGVDQPAEQVGFRDDAITAATLTDPSTASTPTDPRRASTSGCNR